jgi:hypothetical protein
MPYARTLSSVHKLSILEGALHAGMIEIPVDGGAWTLSNGFRELFGIALGVSDVVNNIIDALHPQDRQTFRDALVLMRTGISPQPSVFRVLKSNGLIRSIYIDFRSLTNEMGVTQKFVGVLRDVTQEAAFQRMKREMAQRIDTIMRSTGVDCVFRIDSHGHLFDYVTRGALQQHPSALGSAWQRLGGKYC